MGLLMNLLHVDCAAEAQASLHLHSDVQATERLGSGDQSNWIPLNHPKHRQIQGGASRALGTYTHMAGEPEETEQPERTGSLTPMEP